MKRNLIAIAVFVVYLAVMGLAGSSDYADARRVRGYYIAGVYK